MSELTVNNKTTIYGDRLELTNGEKPLAFGKTCQLEINAETLETSNKMSGDWVEYLVGKLSFSISTSSLLTYSDTAEVPELENVLKFGDLLATMVLRNPIDFALSKITKVEGGGFSKEFDFVSGKVIITKLSVSADDGQITTCTADFQGTGKLKLGDKFAGTAIESGVQGVSV